MYLDISHIQDFVFCSATAPVGLGEPTNIAARRPAP